MVERVPGSDAAASATEVPVSAVTSSGEGETAPVRLVSGEVAAPVPGPPRDGFVTGPPVYSAEHCPLLVEDASTIDNRTVVENHVGQDGESAGRTVHRYPEHLLTNPVQCPSCDVMREQHGLVLNTETGERDCAIAIQRRRNPKYTAQFGADAAARAQVNADSQDAGLGPAAAGNAALSGSRRPVRSQDLESENLSEEAQSAKSAASAQPDVNAPLTEDADGKTLGGENAKYGEQNAGQSLTEQQRAYDESGPVA